MYSQDVRVKCVCKCKTERERVCVCVCGVAKWREGGGVVLCREQYSEEKKAWAKSVPGSWLWFGVGVWG